MKTLRFLLILLIVVAISGCEKENKENNNNISFENMIIDHNCTDLVAIPAAWIDSAKLKLHIAYGHTSHGSQLTTGMAGLIDFKGIEYAWNNGVTNGALDLHDYAMSGDLGNPDRTSWADRTRTYLDANQKAYAAWWLWAGLAGWGGNK